MEKPSVGLRLVLQPPPTPAVCAAAHLLCLSPGLVAVGVGRREGTRAVAWLRALCARGGVVVVRLPRPEFAVPAHLGRPPPRVLAVELALAAPKGSGAAAPVGGPPGQLGRLDCFHNTLYKSAHSSYVPRYIGRHAFYNVAQNTHKTHTNMF